MKHKRNYLTLNRYTVSILVVLAVVITIFATLTISHYRTDASSEFTQKTPGHPQFSFNAAGAPGWRQGPSDKVSLALFQSKECFTSIVHKSGTIDPAAALRKTQASLTSSGYTSTPGDIVPVVLRTNAGQQQYELHQYAVSGTGSGGQVYGGQEFGYLQLSGSYVTIEGYCNTTDELDATIPALQAIKFDASK